MRRALAALAVLALSLAVASTAPAAHPAQKKRCKHHHHHRKRCRHKSSGGSTTGGGGGPTGRTAHPAGCW